MLCLSPNLAQVQRNCCLTLCNFSIPEELEFQYRRVNELLLGILSPTRQDESIQRIAVHLCNALVCQVDNDHKEAVGKMGFVVVCELTALVLLFSVRPQEDLGSGVGGGGNGFTLDPRKSSLFFSWDELGEGIVEEEGRAWHMPDK